MAPGDHWAVPDVDAFCLFGTLPSFIASCADSVMFTIPDIGVTCGTVAGTSWYDVVLEQRMEGANTVLDVAQLSRGLYTLNWHAVNGTVTTQRFVRE